MKILKIGIWGLMLFWVWLLVHWLAPLGNSLAVVCLIVDVILLFAIIAGGYFGLTEPDNSATLLWLICLFITVVMGLLAALVGVNYLESLGIDATMMPLWAKICLYPVLGWVYFGLILWLWRSIKVALPCLLLCAVLVWGYLCI